MEKKLIDIVGEQRLHQIVDCFYEKVFKSPVIGRLFQTDKSQIIYKQKLFLTQFLGGPAAYSLEFGHPRMRMRHLPHKIDEAAKEEWLLLMRQSIHEVIEDKVLAEKLYHCFPPVAQHMVNA